MKFTATAFIAQQTKAHKMNNNEVRNRLNGKPIQWNGSGKESLLVDDCLYSPLKDKFISLPLECRLLILCHQFLTLRSNRRLEEAKRCLHSVLNHSLLPHYNLHQVIKNLKSLKAFPTPAPSHVLCEFQSGEYSYSERIYFKVLM